MTVPYIPPTASTHSDHATLARRQRNSLHVPAQTPIYLEEDMTKHLGVDSLCVADRGLDIN
jgi:hypothetical protein